MCVYITTLLKEMTVIPLKDCYQERWSLPPTHVGGSNHKYLDGQLIGTVGLNTFSGPSNPD